MYLGQNKFKTLKFWALELLTFSIISLLFHFLAPDWTWGTHNISALVIFTVLGCFIPFLEFFIYSEKNIYFFKFFFFFIVIKAIIIFSFLLWYKSLGLPEYYYFYIMCLYLSFIVLVTYYLYILKYSKS